MRPKLKTWDVVILRVTGTRETYTFPRPLTIRRIHELLGIACSDSVVLGKGKVMIVDDTGLIDGKPLNHEASLLYTQRCGGFNWTGIHGDVAIVADKDFQ